MIENPCVGGSIPPRATKKKNDPWRFTDFSTHPSPGYHGSTAAGMYQITKETWRDYGVKAMGEYDGVEKELVRRKYMEVDSCSNDSARCVLYYRKKDVCLRVDTIGEHVRGMKVVRWTDECPAPASPAAR